MGIEYRQTTSYNLQSSCGDYRVAKCKTQNGWRYIPFVAELCLNAWGKEVKRWYPIERPLRTADEAKEVIEQWCQAHKKK